jgi:hypothetical protein
LDPVPKKENELPYNPIILLLGIYPKGDEITTCAPMFVVA